FAQGEGLDLIHPLTGAPSPARGRRSGKGGTGGFLQRLPPGGKLSPARGLMRGKPPTGTNLYKNAKSRFNEQSPLLGRGLFLAVSVSHSPRSRRMASRVDRLIWAS